MNERLRTAAEFACVIVISIAAGWMYVPAGLAVFGVLTLLGLQGVSAKPGTDRNGGR